MFDIVIRTRNSATAEQPANPIVLHAKLEFERFYRDHATTVARLAYALCGDRHRAEELTQDAFIVAYRQWPRLEGYDRPDLWVRRAVLHRAANEHRRRGRERRAIERLGSRPQRHEELEVADRELWAAVADLPPRQAQAIVLAYVEDRSHADIAAVFGCSVKTVSVHLHLARRALARVLRDGRSQGEAKRDRRSPTSCEVEREQGEVQ